MLEYNEKWRVEMKTYKVGATYNNDCSRKVNPKDIVIDGLKLSKVKEAKLLIREIGSLLLVHLQHKEKTYLLKDIKMIEETMYGVWIYCNDFVIRFDIVE